MMDMALYARVSSEKQDVNLFIFAKLKALRECVDEAESGRTSRRPALRRMIAKARRLNLPFRMVLVWKYSRFARSREDSIVYNPLLRKHGVQVVSITEPADDTPIGRLLEAIIESLDEFYSQNLGQEISRGMRESASRGFFVHSRTPYGYRRVKVEDGRVLRNKLEPDPQIAPVAAWMFRQVLRGWSLKRIGRNLNARGILALQGSRGATRRCTRC